MLTTCYDSNKWSNIGSGEAITQVKSIEAHFSAPYLEIYICSWILFNIFYSGDWSSNNL